MPRYDDDDNADDVDLPRRRSKPQVGWLDQQFRDTHVIILVLFSLCCGWIALIFGIVGVATCKDPTARTNATIVLVVSGISACLSAASVVVRMAAGQH
jgi:uncharacterized membrane protein